MVNFQHRFQWVQGCGLRMQQLFGHSKLLQLVCSRACLLATLLWIVLSAGSVSAATVPGNWIAYLPQGNAVTDPKALLRLALPIENSAIRQVQANLEDISNQIRGKRWSAINGEIIRSANIIQERREELLASIPAPRQAMANSLLTQLDTSLAELKLAAEAKDREQLLTQKAVVLDQVGDLEALMVTKFPFDVPTEYQNLPQLRGRAKVLISTNKGDLTLVTDGFSAPVTAGDFVDLVKRGFYDGLEFTRAEESYVLQAGDPPGPEVGFIDPKTKQYRAIPLEILVKGDPKPTYGITLEDAGRYREQPVLPFSAYGAVALARNNDDPNSGSSQFFFFLFEPELTPAGLNLLDGRYAVFGYVIEGADTLRELRQGDKILSAKVVEGAENLISPA